MSKSVFICEKPSVAMDFAKALGMSIQRKDGYLEDENYIITWAYGHLVTMSYPEVYDEKYKKWDLENLPFIPLEYLYEVIPGSKDQFKAVKTLLNRSDVDRIYNCGDSAREGEYIQRLIFQEAGCNPNAAMYRVWIDSQTKEEILNGIKNAKPLSDYDRLAASAYARAKEDYLVGMNFSRGLSVKYGTLLNNANGTNEKGKYKPVAVGRVMSCVLGMIVERERQIRNATIIPFYKLQSDLGNGVMTAWKIVEGSKYFGSPQAYNDVGLLSSDLANELMNELNCIGSMNIVNKEKSVVKKQAPLLFNLAELQSTCTKLFHISPAETLAVAQSLYEKKLTTYPRTDARVLSTAVSKEIEKNINGLMMYTPVKDYAKTILENGWHTDLLNSKSKYIDDSKISDHYAIIPTGSSEGLGALSSLNTLEKSVYELICRRFLSIYYPAAEYNKIVLTGKTGTETFNTSCTVLVKEGFLAVVGRGEDADEKEDGKQETYNAIDALNGTVPASFSVSEGKSQPPKRYTTGSMILAMENAGQLIEDPELREQIKGAGIGTSATRAAVLEKLEKNEYISVNSKTQQITPAKLGEFIYDLLVMSIPTILNPAYTASWERGLEGIEKGNVDEATYMNKINQYIASCTAEIKANDFTAQIKQSIENLKSVYKDIKSTESVRAKERTAYKCPICGKDVITVPNSKTWFCVGYKEGCKFSIMKEWGGKKLPESMIKHFTETMQPYQVDVKQAIISQPTKVEKFKSKEGKEFSASLQLSYTDGDQWTKIIPTFAKKN